MCAPIHRALAKVDCFRALWKGQVRARERNHSPAVSRTKGLEFATVHNTGMLCRERRNVNLVLRHFGVAESSVGATTLKGPKRTEAMVTIYLAWDS